MGEKEAFIAEFKGQARLRMRESLDKIQECLKLLDDTSFWYRPNAHSNSTGNLLMHLSGNIRQYMLSGLGGEPDTRQRDLEFQVPPGGDRTAVTSEFFQVAARALEILSETSGEQLLQPKRVQGFELTGLGIILHVAEHLSYHTGQIAYLTKMQMDRDLGFYKGQDLNAKND